MSGAFQLSALFRNGKSSRPATLPGTWLISRVWSVWGGADGVRVQVQQGRAWATLGQGGGDMILEKGQGIFVPPGQQAVFSPLGDTDLILKTCEGDQLEQPPVPAVMRLVS